eukprot:Seg1894.2 transcript_id=Seg1894.2/GoldUCD/mRNA.D3Y31 product="hypothetical protein" protein_id=Seg1894.2/GoldUCD/D3Y31
MSKHKGDIYFPLGPIPWSLTDTFGNLQKTNKAALLHHLEKGVTPEEGLPMNSAAVFDATAIVQRHKPRGTFGDLATDILRGVITSAQTNRIYVVFDVYRTHAIKNVERGRGEKVTLVKFTSLLPGHAVKGWAKFLKSSHNKKALIKFLVYEWKKREVQTRSWVKRNCSLHSTNST